MWEAKCEERNNNTQSISKDCDVITVWAVCEQIVHCVCEWGSTFDRDGTAQGGAAGVLKKSRSIYSVDDHKHNLTDCYSN